MNKNNSRNRPYLYIAIAIVVILGGWFLTLKHNWKNIEQNKVDWPDWEEDSLTWQKLKGNLDVFKEYLTLTEENTSSEEAKREMISNPQNLSLEEVEQIEAEVFPKEKNAQTKEE